MTVKNWLVSLVDPAGGYMRRQHSRKFPHRRAWLRKRLLSTKVITTTSPPPEMQQRMKEREDRLTTLLAENRPYFEAKAAELIGSDSVTIVTTKGNLHAKLVRFRRGEAVVHAELPHGNSMSRLSLARDSTPFITYWLASNVVSIAVDAEPKDE